MEDPPAVTIDSGSRLADGDLLTIMLVSETEFELLPMMLGTRRLTKSLIVSR
jgi:hypothetical protein